MEGRKPQIRRLPGWACTAGGGGRWVRMGIASGEINGRGWALKAGKASDVDGPRRQEAQGVTFARSTVMVS